MKKIIIILLFIGILSSTLSAKLYKSYEIDSNSSMKAAIEKAENGDTLLLHEGIYEFDDLVINKSLNIKGEGRSKTIIHMIGEKPMSFLSYAPFYSTISDLTINSNTSGLLIFGTKRGEGKVKIDTIAVNCKDTGISIFGFGNRILNSEIKADKICIHIVNNTDYSKLEDAKDSFSNAKMRVKVFNCKLTGNPDRNLEDAYSDVDGIVLNGHGQIHLGENEIKEVDTELVSIGSWLFTFVKE